MTEQLEELWGATRQFKHNHGKGNFVFGYDCEFVDRLVANKNTEITELKSHIERLTDFAIWMTGASNRFGDLEYFKENRHLLTRSNRKGVI